MTSKMPEHACLHHHLTRRSILVGAAATAVTAATNLLPAAFAATAEVKTVVPGALTIAMNGDMPMTSVKDGKIIGTDGEMISKIAEKLGLTAQPALMDWSATIESVRGGRADVMLGNMGWTQKRAEVMLLTDPIYYTPKFTLMRKDMPVGDRLTLEDMKDRTLGTVQGFTIVPELKQVPGAAEVRLYDTTDACVRDIRAGRLDFGFLDTPTISYMIQQNPDWDLKVIPTTSYPQFKILGVKQLTLMGMNPENTDLFDALNAGIAWLWKTGGNKEFLAKYGLNNPDFLVPPERNPRIGIDRDEKGTVLGPWAHAPKDFSSFFG